jgi:hypothetical protein
MTACVMISIAAVVSCLVVAPFGVLGSALVSQEQPAATEHYCGAMPSIQAMNTQSMITNMSLQSDGNYTIIASVPTNYPPTCIQQGTYTYDAVSKKNIFSASNAIPNPGEFYCSSWGFDFTYAMETSRTLSSKKVTLYGIYHDQLFSIPSSANNCFARVPSGTYCGTALDVQANLVISAPFNFALNIEAVILPCSITGFYVLNAAFGNVIYEVGSSNCTEYLIFNNVTYGNNPSSLKLVGSAYGIGFSTTMTEAQCPSN